MKHMVVFEYFVRVFYIIILTMKLYRKTSLASLIRIDLSASNYTTFLAGHFY